MKNKIRNIISGLLYTIAFISFVEAIMVTGGNFLDFSDLARLIFCIFSVICVIAATLTWRARDAEGKRKKFILMIVAIVVIVSGGFVDDYLEHNKAAHEYTADMYRIKESVIAKFETADGKALVVEEEIDLLTSLAEYELQVAPMTPADDPEDWIYRITFNPIEYVPNGEEVIAYIHEKYVHIGSEYYLPIGNASFDGILECFHGLATYFFD